MVSHPRTRRSERWRKTNLAELRKRRPEGPYFIGSLCAGALIAIAMARKLAETGETDLLPLLLDPRERPGRRLHASRAKGEARARRSALSLELSLFRQDL
jgi:thioesterase domain-containing protein